MLIDTNSPMRMPYEGKDVPHCVIEVNQKCNITCKACYKSKSSFTKPVDQIKEEIDYVLTKRNISGISLAGGEPCLHPELEEVISYIANKGINVQILSNGLILDEKRLKKYKKAGLSKVYLHIDGFQKRPDLSKTPTDQEITDLRNKIAKRITHAGLQAALVVTLYQRDLNKLDELIAYVNESPYFHRLLVTCCADFRKIMSCNKSKLNLINEELSDDDLAGQEVSLSEVEGFINKKISWRPFAFVASNQNLNKHTWLFYTSFSIFKGNEEVETFYLPPSFKNVNKYFHDKAKRDSGRYPFGSIMDQKTCIKVLLLHGIMSGNPLEMGRVLIFLKNLLNKKSKISQKSFIFQQGPEMTEKGIEYCKDCPDATIRDGKLVPICTADFIVAEEGMEIYRE